MNKILTKVTALCVGLAMVAGVGVAIGSKKVSSVGNVYAADGDTHEISSFTGKGEGTIINNGATPAAIDLSDPGYSVKQVIIGWSHNKSNDGCTASVSVGGESLGSGKVGGSSGDNTTTIGDGNTSLTGAISITWTNGMTGTKKGTLYINSLTLVEGSTGSSATLESIEITGSMTKTAYTTAESWDPTGFVVTAYYDDESSKDVTSNASWRFSPVSPTVSTTSVVATATYGEKSASSTAQNVTVTKANGIQAIYTKTSGASVDVYGYYVGFLDGTGPVIMDGDYGIVAYNSSADVSGYTVNETILHVTGSVSIYKGLYEIGSPSISVASGTYDAPDTPVVYATAGGETAEYASRLTTVTGTATVASGSFDSDAGTADITMNFTVGSKTVQVFYKKAAQTADADAFAAMKQAVTDGTEITIKGFTGWYNGFQVQMNGYIPAAQDYTAEDFAQDLLNQTDAVCAEYEEGDNNHDALVAIWSNLASNDKYPSLPSAEKTKLAEAERDESGTVVEQAMARYDFLTGKYSLSNFINGRTPIVPAGSYLASYENNLSSSSSITIIVIVAVASMTLLGVTLVIRKRKMN